MSLEDRKYLIVGAAGLLGSSIAELLHQQGAQVVLSDISEGGLEKIKSKLMQGGTLSQCLTITSDITSQEGINELFEMSHRLVGRLHGVIHSAYPRTKSWGCSFEELSQDDLNSNLAMQLGSTIILAQRTMLHFKQFGGGDLVLLSSVQGISAPKFSHYEGTDMSSPLEYSAIKAGIISMTKWLAKFYSNQGIRVNCVSPGGIIDSQPEVFLDRYRQSCTNYGMLRPDQISEIVCFLLSSAASGINGQNIIVDDGWSL